MEDFLRNHFTLVKAKCNQGQRKPGVMFGPDTIQDNVFNEYDWIFIDLPNRYFNSKSDYKNLFDVCKSTKYPFTIGGDHSIGVATVSASVAKHGDNLAVVWIDAHADINTIAASISKNTHGTPVSVCVGLDEAWWPMDERPILKYENLKYVGIRDLDEFEKDVVKNNNITVFNPDDAIEFIKTTPKNIHISFDVDGLDPSFLDSTGTIAPSGVSPLDVRRIIMAAIEEKKLVGLDLVEFNPDLGDKEKSLETIKQIFA